MDFQQDVLADNQPNKEDSELDIQFLPLLPHISVLRNNRIIQKYEDANNHQIRIEITDEGDLPPTSDDTAENEIETGHLGNDEEIDPEPTDPSSSSSNSHSRSRDPNPVPQSRPALPSTTPVRCSLRSTKGKAATRYEDEAADRDKQWRIRKTHERSSGEAHGITTIIHQANDIQQDPLPRYDLQAFFVFAADFDPDTVPRHYYEAAKSLESQQW